MSAGGASGVCLRRIMGAVRAAAAPSWESGPLADKSAGTNRPRWPTLPCCPLRRASHRLSAPVPAAAKTLTFTSLFHTVAVLPVRIDPIRTCLRRPVFHHQLILTFENTSSVSSSVFRKSRGGGGGLGGRHFTQGGRRTEVIGGTFRRDFSSLEGT